MATSPSLTYEQIDADRMRRMQPSSAAVITARTLMTQYPMAEHVIIPMCFPGKRYGVWQLGQEVRTVLGVTLAAGPGLMSYSLAREMALQVAEQVLLAAGDADSSFGYAVVTRGEAQTPVFEH